MSPKKSRTLFMLLFTLLAPFLLSGCWERRELNEMGFILGMGLDKAESGYRVTMQVVIPSAISSQTVGGTGGGGVPVVVSDFTVPTIYEADRQYSLLSSRSGYKGHIRVLVIGEELARAGIAETLDVLIRSREPRNDYYVMVAKDTTAKEVLKILTPMDKLPANKLFNAMDKSHKESARTVAVPLIKFIENLIYEGINPVLTGVEITGNAKEGDKKSNLEESTPRASLRYRSVAVFKKDKMIGWLSDGEVIGFNYISNNIVHSSGPIIGDDGRPIVIEALHSSTKRKVKIINGEPHIYIHVKAECNVEEVESRDNLESEKVITELEKKSEERIVYLMKSAAEQINEKYNVDIMGFGQMIYRAKPQAWAKLQQRKGEDYLKSLPVHYSASVSITRIGVTDKSFVDDIKE
ncbi:Ger(x)C family spore germination protein [Paenibacillus riograndensis]|uniref:Germination protein, Ger(X)C family n=1 Tax=Paenibacillus riograndensis SBR5 TaxID=1073571 RepID=A0A0E4HA18_9BACL|nr:Ger(x)C family spore germination protein [Paenibacillus riograndensis]CQR54681.1 germination protein, Ger(x)C family [Paenibacillus riograndensis SBR5]